MFGFGFPFYFDLPSISWPDASAVSFRLSSAPVRLSTNTLLQAALVFLASLRSLQQRSCVEAERWLAAGLVLRGGKMPIVERSSVLKQGRERKRDSTWSSPGGRRSWWRGPVATDKVRRKKSKMTFNPFIPSKIIIILILFKRISINGNSYSSVLFVAVQEKILSVHIVLLYQIPVLILVSCCLCLLHSSYYIIAYSIREATLTVKPFKPTISTTHSILF